MDDFERLTGSLPWQVVLRCRSGETGTSYHATKQEAETVRRLLLGLDSIDTAPAGMMLFRPVNDDVIEATVEWRRIRNN